MAGVTLSDASGAAHEVSAGVKQVEDNIALGLDPDLDPSTDLPAPLVRD